MSTDSTHDATGTPEPHRSLPRRRIASGELLFVRLETPRTLPAYPSFHDRLATTDTWNNRSRDQALSPAASSSRYSTSPWHGDSDSSFDRADSVASNSYSDTSFAPPSAGHRRHSTSSSEALSWREKQARRTAAAEAVRQAVSNGTLDANSYTDGQLYSVKAEAEKHCAPPARDEGGGGATAHKGKKRRRTSGLEGREGQIAHAVKIRRLEGPPHDETDSEDGPAEQVEEVEVDLTKLLGM
ncbi:Proteophosphoglycan ppg4 [Rhodotorula toruloides]|nr:Proteophosphoglycan ppg4 [Rhodotorula toruloides]